MKFFVAEGAKNIDIWHVIVITFGVYIYAVPFSFVKCYNYYHYGKCHNLFYPWEATMINSIFVSEVDNVDTLVCPLTPDGEY